MKNYLLFVLFSIYCFSCQLSPTDPWKAFAECADNDCLEEALEVKDAFLKDPKTLLTQFQATYEQGDDHVIGWLFIIRDSVLLNPDMGTIPERLAMQKALIDASEPFLGDTKIHEMAESVINELQMVDVVAGKINDPMDAIETGEICYQFVMNADTTSCHLSIAENGEFNGFYAWVPDGKDATLGIIKGTQIGDTLVADYQYIQEGQTFTDGLIFIKQGDKLIDLVSEIFDDEGKMDLTDRKNLKAGETLIRTDCAKLADIVEHIQAMKLYL